jgi:hypothetical protein
VEEIKLLLAAAGVECYVGERSIYSKGSAISWQVTPRKGDIFAVHVWSDKDPCFTDSPVAAFNYLLENVPCLSN